MTYAEISAQGISIPMPRVEFDKTIDEGDKLQVGDLSVDVWHTPGPCSGAVVIPIREPALLRRQHLPRWLRGQHRRPSRFRSAGVHQLAEAHQGERCRMASSQSRPDLP